MTITNLTAEEQTLLDEASDKDLAAFLILKDRAAIALKALDDLDSMAAAISAAVDDDEEKLAELANLLR